MKTIVFSLLLALPLVFVPGAFAQQETFTVNPAASQVAFSLKGSDHGTNGTFHVQSGKVEFQPGVPKMSGSIVVSAASGDSGNNSRDKKMKKKVLDVKHFADITFAPQSYQGTIAPKGDSTIQVTGIFTLHGTPHNLTVPMQIHMDGSSLTAKTHFVVPYVKWGLKNPSFFILKVAKQVNIDLTLAGKVSSAS